MGRIFGLNRIQASLMKVQVVKDRWAARMQVMRKVKPPGEQSSGTQRRWCARTSFAVSTLRILKVPALNS
jgi:hypothetical protein